MGTNEQDVEFERTTQINKCGRGTDQIVATTDAAEISEDHPLRSISPRGYCVEGLDAQTLAYLLQVVG